ncbi:RusA family crossover junction endodeoxyribonuclease [Hwanghaeella sp. LZ110]|jgi:hypothetical protein|uniref:RusA family crossover junction endodeoxyribonuclease n=1 Tax=Hwanghaeella sp. LZ110 TaxID=3402810 RepID=UPI003B67DB9C
MDIEFPIEVIVLGTPISLQATGGRSKKQWKDSIVEALRIELPKDCFLSDERLDVTIYIFPDGEMEADLDNVIKPILDAMVKVVYLDDNQVDRIVAQRFNAGFEFQLQEPSPVLSHAVGQEKPLMYLRIHNEPIRTIG